MVMPMRCTVCLFIWVVLLQGPACGADDACPSTKHGACGNSLLQSVVGRSKLTSEVEEDEDAGAAAHARLMSLSARGGGFDAKAAVAKAWKKVTKNKAGRVTKDAFVNYCVIQVDVPTKKSAALKQYCGSLFDAGTAMMLPTKKTDLGKHCFGYALLLANEFYGDVPEDRLHLLDDSDNYASVRSELNKDWQNITKDSDGRVGEDVFIDFFSRKFASRLPESKKAVFTTGFLSKTFKAGLAMMLPKSKTTLGGHCFRYAALFVREFYFGKSGSDTLGILAKGAKA